MREKLEKKICERPADLKRHQAYAAWLRENEDPRAELIDLQLALESSSLPRDKRFELESDQQELLDRHGREWLGEVAKFVLLHPDEPGYSL